MFVLAAKFPDQNGSPLKLPWNMIGIFGFTALVCLTTALMYFCTQVAPLSDKAAGVPNLEKSGLSAGSLMGASVYDCGLPDF